jgi:hypothetical protein
VAAKLTIATLVVGAAGAGTWLGVSPDSPLRDSERSPAGATSSTTSLSQAAHPASPITADDVTVIGPSTVPYGEPAAFEVVVDNPTEAAIEVAVYSSFLRTRPDGRDSGFVALFDPPSDQLTKWPIAAGGDQTWSASVTTRVRFSGVGTYEIVWYVEPTPLDPDQDPDWIALTTPLDITAPIRALDPHWDELCRVVRELDATEATWEEMHRNQVECANGQRDDDPKCPDEYLSTDYYYTKDELIAEIPGLETRRDEQLEHFTTRHDLGACLCWCAPETYPCGLVAIPWDTTVEVPTE